MKSPPLTTFERGVLLQLVKQKEHIIENKRTDAVTVAQKKRGWTEISREFCSTANTTPRSGRQLKKCWLNLKQRARKERLIKELQATGGVQSCARPDPFIQLPDSLLPHANFNCCSQLSSNNFVRDDEVMNVVGFGEYELHGVTILCVGFELSYPLSLHPSYQTSLLLLLLVNCNLFMLLKQTVFVLKKSSRKTSYRRNPNLNGRIFRSRKDH